MKQQKIVRLACFGLASALLLTAAVFACFLYSELEPAHKAESSLFVPTKELADDKPLTLIAGVTAVETTFDCNGKKLNGWYYKNPKSDTVVLLSHGNAFNVSHTGTILAIEDLLSCGQSVFAYDYAGYGRSEGKEGTKSAISSALAAYDYLHRTLHYKPEQINAVGVSLGAAITAQLMIRRQLAKVVLVSAFTCPRAVALDISPLFGIYPIHSFDSVGLVTIEALKHFEKHPPLLIIHGEGDQLVRLHQAKENFAAASEPRKLVVFGRSDHRCPTPEDREEFLKVVKRFLDGVPE
jgi:pimeloyl-ACP methyl ester carboxylesterase